MRIDIVTYEGFLIVAQIIKKGASITNVPVKVRSKTIVKIKILNRKCNSCSTSFKWQKGQIRRFSGVLHHYKQYILHKLLDEDK